MKKKCTNAKCRKTFTVSAGTKCCPYCGKKYPNMVAKEKTVKNKKAKYNANLPKQQKKEKYVNQFDYMLKSINGIRIMPMPCNDKAVQLRLILLLRRWTDMGLIEAKTCAEGLPVVLNKDQLHYYNPNSGNKLDIGSVKLVLFAREVNRIGYDYEAL